MAAAPVSVKDGGAAAGRAPSRTRSARDKSTYQVFLPPPLVDVTDLANLSSADAAEAAKGRNRRTRLVKVGGRRSARNAEDSKGSRMDPVQHEEQDENIAKSPGKVDKGKGKACDAPAMDPSPRQAVAAAASNPSNRPEPSSDPSHIRRSHPQAATSMGSATSLQPSPTPAEQAAARLAAKRLALTARLPQPQPVTTLPPSATSDSRTGAHDDTSPGAGRGLPPGEEYESRMDNPTSWTDTFLRGLDEQEAELTSRGIIPPPRATPTTGTIATADRLERWTGMFSPGTTAVGQALQCAHPEEEAVSCSEPEGEAYISGPQAEQSLGRALRAESEVREIEEQRESARRQAEEDNHQLSIWPIPSALSTSSSNAGSGKDKTANRVRFVSAKDMMASTQVGSGPPAPSSPPPGKRPLLEVIRSQQEFMTITPSSTKRRYRDDDEASQTEDEEEEEEIQLVSPRRKRIAGISSSDRSRSSSSSRHRSTPKFPNRCASCGHSNAPSQSDRRLGRTTAARRDISHADTSRSGDVSDHRVPRARPDSETTTPSNRSSHSTTPQARSPVCSFSFMSSARKPRPSHRRRDSSREDSRRLKRVRSDEVSTSSLGSRSAGAERTMRRAGSDDVTSRSNKGNRSADLEAEETRSSRNAVTTLTVDHRETVPVAVMTLSARPPTRPPAPSLPNASAAVAKPVSTSTSTTTVVAVPAAAAPPPRRPPLAPSRLAQSFTAESLERADAGSESIDTSTSHRYEDCSLGGGSVGGGSTFNATGADSIPPPPTLYFNPNHVTSIASILTHPTAYLSARSGGPAHQQSAPRFNLLALVRQIGPLEEVGTKVYKQGRVVEGAVNMTHRSELVLMDGAGAMLKVCLWGDCATQWAGIDDEDDSRRIDDSEEDEDEPDLIMASQQRGVVDGSTSHGGPLPPEKQRTTNADMTTFSMLMRPGGVAAAKKGLAKKPCPPLRPGDVVSLQSIILSVRRSATAGAGAGGEAQIQASASERTHSTAELCWRWDVRNAREKRKYTFDPALVTFDRRCKEVYACARRWRAGS